MQSIPSEYAVGADLFNALAHPVRLEILDVLRQGEWCVCHIQAVLDQRQAYISQHLKVLRQAGLVTSRKDGLRVYYQVSQPELFDLLLGVRRVLQAQGKLPQRSAPVDEPARLLKKCACPQCAGEGG